MLVDNCCDSDQRNNNTCKMQSTNNIRPVFIQPDINKLSYPENPISEHTLCVDFKKPVNIMNMTKKYKPIGSLKGLLRIWHSDNVMLDNFFTVFNDP